MVSLLSHGRYRPWLAGCAVAVVGFIISYWAVLQQRESVGIIEQTRFTQEAKDYASSSQYKIVLVDGERLADLMIEHDLGVSIAVTYHLKRIDSDFFSED